MLPQPVINCWSIRELDSENLIRWQLAGCPIYLHDHLGATNIINQPANRFVGLFSNSLIVDLPKCGLNQEQE